MTTRQIGIGVLGGGMISQVAHLPFYLEDPRCRVIAIAESRPSLVEHLKGQGLTIVPDHRALLDDDAVEAVVISAPRAAMGPLTLEALEAGKHVMAEKPMAHTVEQAARLAEAADKRGLTYAIGFMKRYDPGVQAARAALEEARSSGRMGQLLLARFRDDSLANVIPPPAHKRPDESRAERFQEWPLWPDWVGEERRDTYAWFMNVVSHDVNLLTYFFPDGLEAVSAASPNDGSVSALLTAGDVPVTLTASKTAAGRWLEDAEFLFERGRIALTMPSPMATDAVGEVVLDDPDAGEINKKLETKRGWCFQRQARGFLDALQGDASPATSGADGLADLRLIEAIWRHITGHA